MSRLHYKPLPYWALRNTAVFMTALLCQIQPVHGNSHFPFQQLFFHLLMKPSWQFIKIMNFVMWMKIAEWLFLYFYIYSYTLKWVWLVRWATIYCLAAWRDKLHNIYISSNIQTEVKENLKYFFWEIAYNQNCWTSFMEYKYFFHIYYDQIVVIIM